MREGVHYWEILKVAAERSVDLIVMGVQGRGALDLLLFGSNTARVSRTLRVQCSSCRAHDASPCCGLSQLRLIVGLFPGVRSTTTQPHAIRPAACLDQHRAR